MAIDEVIEPTLENAGRALEALGELTWGIARELDPSDIVAKPLTIVGDDPRVDLLTLAMRAHQMIFTSVSSRTPNRSSTMRWACAINACTSAAVAVPVFTK